MSSVFAFLHHLAAFALVGALVVGILLCAALMARGVGYFG
jgi:uncharacterized membrane protein